MRILIACGGTGGHFYPGYALGKALGARGHETLFVLRREDPAALRLTEEDLPFAELDLRGLSRSPSRSWLALPGKLARSLWTARNIVRAWRPAVAVGMGGYLTVPVAAAARLRGVPLVLHESNAVLGLANRLSAGGAACLALGLPGKRPGSGTRTALTGTPIREALWAKADPAASRRALGLDPGLATLLVVGGSQGARALNRLVPEALRLLAERTPPPRSGVQVLHLCGKGHAEATRAAYAGLPAVILEFLEDMPAAYGAADLAICRSGASTLAELAAQKLPALLVPYPAATGAHQEANARILEAAGAARLALEGGLSAAVLAELLGGLFDPAGSTLSAMTRAYEGLGLPPPERSAAVLADIVEEAGKPLS